ncbi:MAG: hypothetical protein QOE36_1793 [Gaiellaceae bacterium]|jgi:AcrR family transcriptional regulator|nr:hypothetical protein [Gaiellaceae bacterium]
MSTTRARMPAAERREAILGAAAAEFAKRSYRGTTTAEIAHAAGVSEPILYRHFGSKHDLYLACVDRAWEELRAVWVDAVADCESAEEWAGALGTAYLNLREKKAALADFWVQALTEAGGDPEIRRYLKRHLRVVHEYVASVIVRAQAAGGVPAERDPAAEAWIFISLAVLGSFGRRLGGLLTPEDFGGIVTSRRAWMTGKP